MKDNKDKTSFTREEVEEILQEIFDQEHLAGVYDIISEISSKHNFHIHKPEENDYENEEPTIEDISKLDDNFDIDELLSNEEDF